LINCYRSLTEKNITVDYDEKEHYVLAYMRLGSKGVSLITIDDSEDFISSLYKLPKGRQIISYKSDLYDLTINGIGIYGEKLDDFLFFHYKLPKIPLSLLKSFIQYSLEFTKENLECGAVIYMDSNYKYQLHVPDQQRSSYHVDLYYDRQLENECIHIMDIHSHQAFPFTFSSQDNRDDIGPFLYGVVYESGRQVGLRMGNPSHYGHIDLQWTSVFYDDSFTGGDDNE